MRIAIVDDEDLARLRLRTLIASLPEAADLHVVGEAGDADAALALLQHTPADLLLLDIGMPGLGGGGAAGLRLARALRSLPLPPAVVFVTAHAEHALAAFEIDAVDYLTKPVRAERLAAALQRGRQRLRAATHPAADGPVLVFNERGRVLRLPVAEVLLLKAEQKCVTLRTQAHSHVLDEALTDIEQRLTGLGGDFIRIHRNALVAKRAIRALELRDGDDEGNEGWAVRVAPLDEWLTVSRRQLVAVRTALSADGGAG